MLDALQHVILQDCIEKKSILLERYVLCLANGHCPSLDPDAEFRNETHSNTSLRYFDRQKYGFLTSTEAP